MLALLSLFAPAADACGGFACDNARPVMQAAERILFAVDEANEEVEAHVQITYTGESQDFAWIVPVAGEPEIFLSTDALFSALYFPTNPNYTLTTVELGECRSSDRGVSLAGGSDAVLAPSSATADSGGVNVISTQNVGPYSTTILEADSTAALLDWLDEFGYDVPANFGPVLAPYVASGQNFVALRLLPGNTSGDIAPLGMRYAGTKPSIPIQLTSIAAVPDTRLEVYVVGRDRAVPESYLHVVPNDMAYDYFRQTVTYPDIITRAADEAGGRAFATDWTGSTELMRDVLYSDSMFAESDLAAATDIFAWMDVILSGGFLQGGGYYYYATFDVNLANALRTVLPLPPSLAADGLTEAMFWTNLRYYEDSFDASAIDLAAATAAVQDGFVEPRRHANALFADNPHMSRLTSSLDADEMTVDPTFVFNADMPQEVDINHPATLSYHCEDGQERDRAYREIEFPDGTAVDLPSEDWFSDEHITEYEYLSDLAALNAAVIEQTGAEGEPEVFTDNRPVLAGLADDLNASFADMFMGGCGCDGSGVNGAATPLLAGAAALLARRRRR
jgi:hypothetical protein